MINISRIICSFLVLVTAIGCDLDDSTHAFVGSPSEGAGTSTVELSGSLPLARGIRNFWHPGTSAWCWAAPSPGRQGSALLEILPEDTPGQGRLDYRWVFDPPIGASEAGSALTLVPQDTTGWLTIISDPTQWHSRFPILPLPRLPVVSDPYDNLIDFLKQVTASYFDSIICHWPGFPVPIRLGMAQSGELNLSACLQEGVHIWNEGDTQWFEINEEATWGVRLVHFPGAILRPPMQARITRLDGQGRPLRINIIIGDNYDGPEDRKYAVRAFLHELGHALFLWGHSQDREHILWVAGPPLVDAPSEDERKAARLWHGLPEGLDLKNYLSRP